MDDVIVIVSGGFDPLHSGHVAMIEEARQHGRVVIALNSDEWLTRKKGRPFMSFDERKTVLSQMKGVLEVIGFDDNDGTAKDAIYKTLDKWKKCDVIFANGGDRTEDNIPEMDISDERLSFMFEVGGGNKKNSSSWILEDWKTQRTNREWGYWKVLDDKKTVKVKELVIDPHKSLSDQKHEFRTEQWYILKGTVRIDLENRNGDRAKVILREHESFLIPNRTWHKTTNIGDEPCHVLEVQYGIKCEEDDIVRRD